MLLKTVDIDYALEIIDYLLFFSTIIDCTLCVKVRVIDYVFE